MKPSEFINVYAFATVSTKASSLLHNSTLADLSHTYKNYFFYLPRLVANDGFSISVQVHNGNYCASENGVREFGYKFRLVEWGFPSEEIDAVKFNAEDSENVKNTVGAYVEVELIDELINQHGGLNLEKTLQGGVQAE